MKKNPLILTLFFIILSIFWWKNTGNMFIDFSRESYIPYQMTIGALPFKDIFIIYGVFGYFLNCLIYKISTNITPLILLSHFISYLCVITFYMIAKKFINKKAAMLLSILFMIASIFSNSIFSYTLPYSFSTLWGFFGAYIAFYCYLNKNYKLLYLSLGFIAINRIELFIPLFILFTIYVFKTKKSELKNITFCFVFPLLMFLYLLYFKINLNDLLNNLSFIKTMVNTSSIKHLYSALGVYFQKDCFIISLKVLLKLTATVITSYFLYKKGFKITSFLLIIFIFIFIDLNNIFNLSAVLFLILYLYNLKHNKITQKDMLLLLFTIILCAKSIFKISPLSYGNFGYIFAILALYVLLNKFLIKKWIYNFFFIFLILILFQNLKYYSIHPKFKVSTPIGTLHLTKQDSILFKKTNDYIKKNIKESENFIVVPEGQIFNLVHKKPWNFYNSTFTPLDFETFGEYDIIEKLNQNKTDYIIFYPRNTFDYGAQTICYDYGVNFCTYIMDNYTREAIIEEGYKVLIFKIKDEK